MPTMKTVQTAGPGVTGVAGAERPVPGPQDALMRVRARGTDATFVHPGGMPAGPGGQTRPIPPGHEPAGEITEAGAAVTGLKPGDRVVAGPQAAPSGITGCGGAHGGMTEYLLTGNAAAGPSPAVFPDTLPFEAAALNEPMAVARHCVNRAKARPADKTVVFGAGPTGPGVTTWPKPAGVAHVAVADAIPARLISHRIDFADVHHAFQLALTPGAAEKIIVAVTSATDENR
jgi:threonine dehydrogenase-like Zn-dependent dehydrogenase